MSETSVFKGHSLAKKEGNKSRKTTSDFFLFFIFTKFRYDYCKNKNLVKYIEDIQMFLLNMSFILRVKWTIFIFYEWRSYD